MYCHTVTKTNKVHKEQLLRKMLQFDLWPECYALMAESTVVTQFIFPGFLSINTCVCLEEISNKLAQRGQRSGLPWPCVIFVPFTVHAWWNIFKTGTNIHLESLMIRIWVWADMHVLMDMLLASHSHILLLFVPILDFSFYMLLLFNSVYFCFLFHVVFIFWCCVHGQNMLLFSEYVSICSLTTYVVFVCTLLYYTNLHIDWSVV